MHEEKCEVNELMALIHLCTRMTVGEKSIYIILTILEKNSKSKRMMTCSPNSFDDNELLKMTLQRTAMYMILAILEKIAKREERLLVHQTPSTAEPETSKRTSPTSNSKTLSTLRKGYKTKRI